LNTSRGVEVKTPAAAALLSDVAEDIALAIEVLCSTLRRIDELLESA